ncbi:hypothetical protein DSL72_005731 [Monilinia vaccinii-corymbosi]|uniref:SnoaL-like domain-containing protein n=1 Tax=Monilinia vaccinii-corymbosi TaxID=61207 RepID=A0A8A3PGG6_9HELO|nr:hypothetical protein DSL72_005731 [Monilinia vaccinii-corymbosi]
MKLSNLLAVAGLLHSAVSDSDHSACQSISPGPVSDFQLPDFLPAASPFPDQVATETIRNTLALYSFALDGRNWETLSRVFAPNARANYTEQYGTHYGVQNITKLISEAISVFKGTHHRYATQHIVICSPTSAVSVTYLDASHFLTPVVAPDTADISQVLFLTGRYEDTWTKLDDGSWKILNRNFVFQGPAIGPDDSLPPSRESV